MPEPKLIPEPEPRGMVAALETEIKDKAETRVVLDLRKSDEEGMVNE